MNRFKSYILIIVMVTLGFGLAKTSITVTDSNSFEENAVSQVMEFKKIFENVAITLIDKSKTNEEKLTECNNFFIKNKDNLKKLEADTEADKELSFDLYRIRKVFLNSYYGLTYLCEYGAENNFNYKGVLLPEITN